jgi:spore coat polysaccharide biosynthesis predicted glycosyltransferase SpsG
MKLLFRADASDKIGAGHVMRISAIAEEAISQGIECIFIGNLGGIGWVENRVSSLGLRIFQTLPPDVALNLAEYTLVIDSYDFFTHEQFIPGKEWRNIVVIADPQTPLLRANLIIHPGITGDWFQRKHSNFLFGTNYVPLRKSIKRHEHQINPKLKEIVIFGGGTDSFGFGKAISELILRLDNFDHVTLFLNEKDRSVVTLDARFEILPFGQQLDHRLENADLVLTTASTSSLEILARGIPLGVAQSVDNQTLYYDSLGEAGVVAQLGELDLQKSWKFNTEIVESLIKNFDYRKQLMESSQGVIDLLGSSRILKAISDLG